MANRPITAAGQWAEFSRLVFKDRKPHPIQYQEMRRAFYAGIAGMLTINLEIADIEDDMEGVATMEAVAKECEDFAREINAGRA